MLGGRSGAQKVRRLLLSAASPHPPAAGSVVLSQAPHCLSHFQLLCGAWVQTSSWRDPFGCPLDLTEPALSRRPEGLAKELTGVSVSL